MNIDEGELKLTFTQVACLERALLISIICCEYEKKYSRTPDKLEASRTSLQEWRELLQLTSELYPQEPRNWDLPPGSRNDHE